MSDQSMSESIAHVLPLIEALSPDDQRDLASRCSAVLDELPPSSGGFDAALRDRFAEVVALLEG